MDLIERIKKIAETEGIPESKLILKEAEWFFEEHQYHGYHELRLEVKRGKVSRIGLYCTASDLVRTKICSHHGSDDEASLPSVIYSSEITSEMRYQKERREA